MGGDIAPPQSLHARRCDQRVTANAGCDVADVNVFANSALLSQFAQTACGCMGEQLLALLCS